MANCPEYIRLRSEVEGVLGNLAQVTMLLLELFRSDNSEKYKHLDKELELTVGAKERAVGCLYQFHLFLKFFNRGRASDFEHEKLNSGVLWRSAGHCFNAFGGQVCRCPSRRRSLKFDGAALVLSNVLAQSHVSPKAQGQDEHRKTFNNRLPHFPF